MSLKRLKQFLYLVITRKVEKIMKKQFPADWTPVGVVQVPTFTERKPLLALGRSRRPGCTSQPRQVPHKDLTLVEEEEKEVSQEEDGAGASGSDLSVDSELDYFIQYFRSHVRDEKTPE